MVCYQGVCTCTLYNHSQTLYKKRCRNKTIFLVTRTHITDTSSNNHRQLLNMREGEAVKVNWHVLQSQSNYFEKFIHSAVSRKISNFLAKSRERINFTTRDSGVYDRFDATRHFISHSIDFASFALYFHFPKSIFNLYVILPASKLKGRSQGLNFMQHNSWHWIRATIVFFCFA